MACLNRLSARTLEAEAINLGMVHKRAGAYVSDDTRNRYREQKKRNRRILQRVVAINEHGQAFSLEDLAALGVSNPKNRRNELMARIYGFECIADELGHIAVFITLTCPSRMHSRLSKYCKQNPKFDGTLPSHAQQHLCKTWSRIRAQLKRDGIEIYGFRVSEPHHEGIPQYCSGMTIGLPYATSDSRLVNADISTISSCIFEAEVVARCKNLSASFSIGSSRDFSK
ncbi:MAG: replication endonuclease [Candidatus Nitrotoga sp.]